MLYLVMHLAARIWRRIANPLALWNGRADHVVQPTKSSGSNKIVHVDDSFSDGWIRQHDGLREAIERAKPRSAPAKDAKLDDEWVGPWIRQQQRVRDAIAQAKRRSSVAKD